MKHYLLVFDRAQGRLLRLEGFSTPKEAMQERFKAERLHRGSRSLEVVVFGAQSESAVRETHARYFQDVQGLAAEGAERWARAEASTRHTAS